MKWEHIAANWDQMKGTIRAKWGRITDDDLEVIRGKREVLAGKIREKYADSTPEQDIDREIDVWLRQLH